MAKALTKTRFTAPKIRYRTRTVKVARRGVSAAARVAREEKHTLIAVGAAAALGYAERTSMEIPHIESLGVAGTLGAAAFAAGHYTKSRFARHLATGFLSVAAYKLGVGEGGGGTTEGDIVEGEIPGIEGALEDAYADDDVEIEEEPEE